MRNTAIIFGSILVVVASTWMWLELRAEKNPAIERGMCRFLLCSDDLLLDQAGQQLRMGSTESIQQAVENYREALRRDPASPYRWCDLGDALFAAGAQEEARSCFARAVDRGPSLSQVLWRAGQFYLKLNDYPNALRCMTRILEKSGEFDSFIFEAYAGIPVAGVLDHGLPAAARPAQAYLRTLLRDPEATGTAQVWNWILSRSLADDRLAADYINFLLNHQDYENARDSWAAYLGPPKGPYPQSNSLFNGGFEFEPAGSGFDWKVSELEGVKVSRDSDVRHSGGWSLRLSFDGEGNPAYRNVAQLAVLKPGNYRFEAYLRSSEITTDKGVGIRIGDEKTAELLETNDWTKVEKDFAVEKETKIVRVEIFRDRSLKIDNKIKGTFWIDDAQIISR